MTRAVLLSAFFVFACGEDADETTTTGSGGAGGCVPGELAQADGSCLPAGVPAEACAEGFVAEAGGCVPILPPHACPAGSMALPGETVCREVAPCGGGKWGDDPIDVATTVFVDGSYGGVDSDGTEAKPWTTIQDAIDSAANGDTIAIAAGTYNENPLVQNAALVLRGRCPAMVEVVGVPGAMPAFVIATMNASGTVVKSLAVRGGSAGVAVSGPQQVVIERVWVHDTPDRGIDLEDALGPTEVSVRGSLVERAAGVGIYAVASQVTVEDTVVRDTIPQGAGFVAGHGIQVQAVQPGNMTIRRSLVERNTEMGIVVMGATASVEGTVVRDTAASAEDGKTGRGLHSQFQMSVGQRANVTVTSSFFAGNKEIGLSVASSDLTIETSVVRDTVARPADGLGGIGIGALGWPDLGPTWLAVRQSLVERSQQVGVTVGAAASSLESVWIRDTLAGSEGSGRGFNVQSDPEVPRRATALLRGCVIERSREIGLFGSGSDVELESVRISDTLPNEVAGWAGLGLTVQASETAAADRSTLRMRSSLVERSVEGGVFVVGSDAMLEQCIVRDTAARTSNGTYGDGVAAVAFPQAANVTIQGCRVEGSARAGITNFGSSVALGTTVLECNLIPLHAEPFGGNNHSFMDLQGNSCGCAGESNICKLSTTSLAPPDPLSEEPPLP